MAKEIKIPVSVPGAEESKQQLDGVAHAAQGIGDKAHDATPKTGGFAATISDWARSAGAAILGAIGITSAIQAMTRAMEENAAAAQKQQNALLRLQFLGDFFKEKPELRKEVAALAEKGGRPFEEVAGAWYNLRSKSGALPKATQQAILNEALEMGRTDPSLPLASLVDMFSLYAKKSGVNDANRIQNVLQETIKQAGGSGSDVAAYMPQFMPIGMAGGLSASEAAGLWAYATTQTADPSTATTGLRAAFMGLQGKGTPESQKLLKSYHMTGKEGFADQLTVLSGGLKSGKFGLAQAEQLAGREGAALLLSLAKDPGGVERSMQAVSAKDRSDIDTTATMLNELMRGDPMALAEEGARKATIANDNSKARDIKALQWKMFREFLQTDLRESGKWPINTEMYMYMMDKIAQGQQIVGVTAPTPEEWEAQGKGHTVINHNHYGNNFYPSVGPSTTGPLANMDH